MTRADLAALLDLIAEAIAAENRGLERADSADAITWSAAGTVVAVLGEGGVELRLDPRIAAAAARTPDAAPSSRGPEWVRFNPRAIDPHAVDRLEAWFGLAVRRAADTTAQRRPRG